MTEVSEIYRFRADIVGSDAISLESYPIFDDEYHDLLGAFTVDQGDIIIGFISGRYHLAALLISTGEKFFFTPVDGPDGKVIYGIVSEYKISAKSVATRADNGET